MEWNVVRFEGDYFDVHVIDNESGYWVAYESLETRGYELIWFEDKSQFLESRVGGADGKNIAVGADLDDLLPFIR